MELLTNLSQIEDIDDRKTETVDVPEWNVTVKLRSMAATERDAYESAMSNGGKAGTMNLIGMRARMVALSIVNEENKRVVSDAQVVKLGTRDAKVLDGLFWKCMKLNGMTEEDHDELVENFTDDPSELSTTA